MKPTSLKRPPITSSQPKTKSMACAQKSVSQEIIDATVSCKTDTTAYLIEKMFENFTAGSVDSLNTTNNSITEYQMYHEAKKFDTELSNKKVHKSKLEKEKLDKNVRTKEVAASISKKSIEHETQKHYDDKASDTGTYTIEEEQDSKVENEARQNIDKVFGVDQISLDFSVNLSDDIKETMKKPGSYKQGELTLNLQNINLELKEIEKLEKLRSRQSMGDSMVAELGSAEPRECFRKEESLSSTVDASKWMSEWTALVNQKSLKADMNLSSPGSSASDDSKSGKGSNDYIHKRLGTGRRLPTLPPRTTNEICENIITMEDSPVTSKCDLIVNYTQPGMQSLRQKTLKVSSLVPDQYENRDSEHLSLTKYETDLQKSAVTSHIQACSKTSLDTEILPQDTETVKAAIQKRVGSKATVDTKQRCVVNTCDNNNPKKDLVISNELSYEHSISHKNDSPRYSVNTGDSVNNSALRFGVNTVESVIGLDDSVEFESDTSSVVALVNGDEDIVKPSSYKGPRSVLGNVKLKLTDSLPSKPSISMNGAKSSEKVKKCSPDNRVSLVSDVFSEVNGDIATTRTYDFDAPETHFVRQGSQGKGQMSMTRPNRAFALRRARADSEDVLDSAKSSATFSVASTSSKTPKSAGSMTNLQQSSSIGMAQKPRRTMSGMLAERQPPDTTHSKESMGAQIVQKSRDNINTNFNRADVVRHSVRVNRSLSIPTRQPNASLATNKSKQRLNDGTSSSSIQHSKSLHVTGVSAVSTREKTSSKQNRTTSPKSAERNAWKRRKEYDPRKAVADSKSKGHAAKPGSHFNKSNIVARSSSFSNAKDLKLNTQKDNSASRSSLDDCSRSSEINDVFDDNLRRGFVPYSVRSFVSSKVSNSSDDEIERSARSSSQSSQASTMNRHFKPTRPPQLNSAFTQPPHESPPLSVCKPVSRSRSATRRSKAKITPKTPSPPLPNSVTVSMQKMSFDYLELYQKAPGNKRNSSNETSPKIPESYDSLIVASIYQLSLKLKTQTDKTLEKLRDSDVIENGLDSPLDDLENQSVASEIPAYKSANQELAGVLKNLQRLEKHIKIMNKVLFPDDEMSPDTSKEKNEYLQEIERIKNELAGFQPIDTPRGDVWKHVDTASVESDCEEIDQSFTEIL